MLLIAAIECDDASLADPLLFPPHWGNDLTEDTVESADLCERTVPVPLLLLPEGEVTSDDWHCKADHGLLFISWTSVRKKRKYFQEIQYDR